MKQKIMKSLLKNKRGAISGIISSIGDIIRTAFDTVPKPVKFLLFLLLLLFIGLLIQSILSVTGIYCDSANNPVKLGGGFIKNIELADEVPNMAFLNLEAEEQAEYGISQFSDLITKCSKIIPYGLIQYPDGAEEAFTDKYFFDGTFCTDCESVTIIEQLANGDVFDTHNFCTGTVLRLDKEDKSVWQKMFCGGMFGGCEPPEHYFWSQELDVFLCSDETCEGITLGEKWDAKLQEAEATYLYPEGIIAKTSYEKLVGITCTDIKPNLTVYGIPILDYKIWILLMLVAILVWVLTNIKKK